MNSWDSLTWGYGLYKETGINFIINWITFILQNLCIAEQEYSKNSISCLHRHIFLCAIPWKNTLGIHIWVFFRISSKLKTQVKTMYVEFSGNYIDVTKRKLIMWLMEQTGMTTWRLLLNILDANTIHEAGTYYARQCTRPNFPGNE